MNVTNCCLLLLLDCCCAKCSKRTVTQRFVEEALYQVYCHYRIYWLYIAHTEFLMYWEFLLLNQCYAICHARKQSNMTHRPTGIYRLSAWCRQWAKAFSFLSRTAVVSIDNYFLQHIDVLADHDWKYFAISCFMFCSRCPPPVPSHNWKWGARAPHAPWSRRLWPHSHHPKR